jgi:hypothetical protein
LSPELCALCIVHDVFAGRGLYLELILMDKDNNKTGVTGYSPLITRKEAIQKAGKYAAFTAAAMMLILDPVQSQPPKSPPKPPRPHGGKKSSTKPTAPVRKY